MKNIVSTLKERGFIESTTSEELMSLVENPIKLYVGFDPTADSLHLGNLIPIMGLAWFQRFGHTPIALVGGATGMIGDPSGKSIERNLLDHESVEHNLKGIRLSLESFLKTEVQILNNYDWFKKINLIDFLRDVGKHFRLGTMLAKEGVKTRLGSEEGMSYTEFSYQSLQAYDFLHLFDYYGVTVQMGGNDQWGNITAGTELVRKMRNETVHGLTFPLLTRSDGKKFGKTEGGAIWLNRDKLSPYDFYQYLFGIPDADIIRMLCMLTFLEMEEISQIEAMMQRKSYVPNSAQIRLAEEVTRIVHGEEGLREAQRITQTAKPGHETTLDKKTLTALSSQIPSKTLALSHVVGIKLVDLLSLSGMTVSKGEARRLVTNGGAYLNNQKIVDENFVIRAEHLIESRFLLLGTGKKKKMIIEIK